MADELTIGELSARSGVAPSALRFYERQGLISARADERQPAPLPRATLRRVALVQAGRAAGIPLDQIRSALETLPSSRTPSRRDWERLSRTWRADIDRASRPSKPSAAGSTRASAAAASRSTAATCSTPTTRQRSSGRAPTTSSPIRADLTERAGVAFHPA